MENVKLTSQNKELNNRVNEYEIRAANQERRIKFISGAAMRNNAFSDNCDISKRCNQCRLCRKCSPFIAIPIREKENMEKNAENVIIRKYMHIERTSEGKKRFVTKMPCDKSIINDTLKGSNRAAVIRSTRMKLKRLNDSQRKGGLK